MKKAVSFSLWGDNPIYCVGAIKNAELMAEIYHGWDMVVYYNNTVPKETLDKLDELGCILIDMSDDNLYGMFWRFLAADLEEFDHVIFRDCDSRISKREALAVEEWIKSTKTLHVMRDHPAHGIPFGNDKLGILGGMWGIKCGLFKMNDRVYNYSKSTEHNYGNDQTFLKDLYKRFNNDRCTHDDFFEKIPFPVKRENGRFIGERIDINNEPLTNDHLILL